MCFQDTKSIIQDRFQISPLPISQFITFYCFGLETILHSVRCVRQRVLEPEKDAEDVIYVVGDGS